MNVKARLLDAIILAQIADVASTWYGLSVGATEQNPLGVILPSILKVVACAACVAFARLAREDHPGVVAGFLGIIAGVSISGPLHNLYLIRS